MYSYQAMLMAFNACQTKTKSVVVKPITYELSDISTSNRYKSLVNLQNLNKSNPIQKSAKRERDLDDKIKNRPPKKRKIQTLLGATGGSLDGKDYLSTIPECLMNRLFNHVYLGNLYLATTTSQFVPANGFYSITHKDSLPERKKLLRQNLKFYVNLSLVCKKFNQVLNGTGRDRTFFCNMVKLLCVSYNKPKILLDDEKNLIEILSEIREDGNDPEEAKLCYSSYEERILVMLKRRIKLNN